MTEAIKEFHFKVRRATAYCKEHGVKQDMEFTLHLTQAQFEDDQYRKKQAEEQLARLGIDKNEDVSWYEKPAVSNEFIKKLRVLLTCSSEVRFIPYYAHSFNHQFYKEINVDGVQYRWNSWDGGNYINFAPELV